MTNKVSTLITVSNTIFIVVMCFVWYTHQQKGKQKQWHNIDGEVKTVTVPCGEKQFVYTNTDSKEQRVEFIFENGCDQAATTWTGKGDSIITAGTSVSMPTGRKIRSAYELKPGESLIAESTGKPCAESKACEMNFHVSATK